jgi:Protein of unknown function (DUF2934)
MSKHKIENVAEQIANKGQGSDVIHNKKKLNQVSKASNSENIPTKGAVENNSIQLRAYQIYQEKGGSELDNWLEAERILGNNCQDVSRLINEGDPNTQKLNKVC